MLADFARSYALGNFVSSTTKAYERNWKMRVNFRTGRGKGVWLDRGMG